RVLQRTFLLVAHEVVACLADLGDVVLVFQNYRMDEHHQVFLAAIAAGAAEQFADQRQVAEYWYFLFGFGFVVADEAAQHQYRVVLDQRLGIDFAFVGDEVRRIFDGGRDVLDLLFDIERDGIALIDTRRDFQRDADVLAFDGGERIGGAGGGAGGLAGNERHILADQQRGGFVIDRDDRRRRQDVGLGGRAQCTDRRAQIAVLHVAKCQAFGGAVAGRVAVRSEEHTSELQSRENLVCRLLLEKKKNKE